MVRACDHVVDRAARFIDVEINNRDSVVGKFSNAVIYIKVSKVSVCICRAGNVSELSAINNAVCRIVDGHVLICLAADLYAHNPVIEKVRTNALDLQII